MNADAISAMTSIEGVALVETRQVGDLLEVNVWLSDFTFEVFDKVSQQELELFDRHPERLVRFNIMPADSGARRND